MVARRKPKNNKKLDVTYFVDGRKTPIEYSTIANSIFLGIVAEEQKNLTFNGMLELYKKGYFIKNSEVENVLEAYIHYGYGDKSMYETGIR